MLFILCADKIKKACKINEEKLQTNERNKRENEKI